MPLPDLPSIGSAFLVERKLEQQITCCAALDNGESICNSSRPCELATCYKPNGLFLVPVSPTPTLKMYLAP